MFATNFSVLGTKAAFLCGLAWSGLTMVPRWQRAGDPGKFALVMFYSLDSFAICCNLFTMTLSTWRARRVASNTRRARRSWLGDDLRQDGARAVRRRKNYRRTGVPSLGGSGPQVHHRRAGARHPRARGLHGAAAARGARRLSFGRNDVPVSTERPRPRRRRDSWSSAETTYRSRPNVRGRGVAATRLH